MIAMDPRTPTNLPDDYELGEIRADSTIALIAGGILAAVAILAVALIMVFLP